LNFLEPDTMQRVRRRGENNIKSNCTLICVENMNKNNVFNIMYNSGICVSGYELKFLITYTMYTINYTVVGDNDENHVVNAVHISVFLGHLQGGIRQRKVR
jgi:hypothetical protein